MPVFFIQTTDIVDGIVSIHGDLFRHLAKSLRIKPGESLIFNDEQGTRYVTSVREITKGSLKAGIEHIETNPTLFSYPLVLGQAILKGDKMSWIIQKATELGVGTIVPLQTERVVSKFHHAHNTHLETRWSRIALEAAQQSERWIPPRIAPITTFSQFIKDYSTIQTKLILAERSHGLRLAQQPLPTAFQEAIVIAIGPEGGWSSEELAIAKMANFSFTTLGAQILRAETASLATLAILQSSLQIL